MRAGTVIVGVGVALLAGCGGVGTDGYESSLRYPSRTDPIVVRVPASVPISLPPPGRLDESIFDLKAGGELAVPGDLTLDQRSAVDRVVGEMFGTPAAPFLPPCGGPGGFDLSEASLAAGSRVYGRLCANCHGLAGDGRGPVGPWSYPYPRDFRAGAFKVAVGGSKPTADQLVALLRRGVPGSGMQAYDMLPEADVRAVAAYLVHLSVRGEAEAAGVRAALDDLDPAEAAEAATAASLARWGEPRPPLPVVVGAAAGDAGYADVVRRGRDLFQSPGAGCASCHQDYGRTEAFRYDIWGAPVRVPDLTRGEFRWGRDDATLAARVRHGIPAAGMPASPQLTDTQLSDLVTFVRDLSAPARLPADVRAEVYTQTAAR